MNYRTYYEELHKQLKLNPKSYLNRTNLSDDIIKVIDEHITNKTHALDIGCGGGHVSAYLTHKGLSVVSIDFSKVALDSARSNYAFLNLCCVDAQKMAFRDNSFDLIISLDTIEHLPNLAEHFDEINRILKSGGSYIIKTPTKWIDKAYYLLMRKDVKIGHCSLCNIKDLRRYTKRDRFECEFHHQQGLTKAEAEKVLNWIPFKTVAKIIILLTNTLLAHRLVPSFCHPHITCIFKKLRNYS